MSGSRKRDRRPLRRIDTATALPSGRVLVELECSHLDIVDGVERPWVRCGACPQFTRGHPATAVLVDDVETSQR